ncbi:hypothetical protein RvY_00393 [Ramazzottius varieornatus]|uniref:Uncharacterized protein n=1 Tax=Ramazzottius varieornatus TaxID=947166 RepID=A0A1D1UMJ5_RAMVA|nr:hypothetical protein RvY_00393 [Ramazzottius varieornatus]
MPPPAATVGTSRLNNGTLLSELAKIARSKSALARGPSRAQGYENRREFTRRPPSPVSRSKSLMVQKSVKRTVSSPARNERPTNKTRRPVPANRLAQASAASSRVTRSRKSN